MGIIGIWHPDQDKIRRRRKHGHTGQPGHGSRQIAACGPQGGGLLVQHLQVVEREFGRCLGQHVDVVRRPHFVELLQQFRRRRHVTEADAGQSQLGNGTHHDQIREFRQAVHEALLRERLVGLVHHRDAGVAQCLDDFHDGRFVEQVAGRVVRVGQVDQRGLVLGDRGQHGGLVQRQVGLQRHAHVVHAGVDGRALVHDEGRRRRQHHGAAFLQRARHVEDGDQFIGTVAEDDVIAGRHAQLGAHALLQRGVGSDRIAVQGDGGQALAQLLQQMLRQVVRVLHRIQLDKTTRIGDVVAADGTHVGTNGVGDEGVDGRHLTKAPEVIATLGLHLPEPSS